MIRPQRITLVFVLSDVVTFLVQVRYSTHARSRYHDPDSHRIRFVDIVIETGSRRFSLSIQ